MKVIHRERTAFARQIREATVIMIAEGKGPGVLNKRQEYTRCLVPSLGVNNNEQVQKKSYTVEEKSRKQNPDERYKLEKESRIHKQTEQR